MSTLSTRKIKHDSSSVDNITLDSSGRVGVGSPDLSAFGRKFLVDGTGGFNNSSGTVGIGFSRGASNTYGYIGTGDWAVNGLSNADFGISSGATGALVLGTGAGTERVRIDASGRVTMPYQPAFNARLTSGNTSSTSTLVFNDVNINRGSYYNSSNGLFTAPIAGVYFFSARFRASSGELNPIWVKNGTDLAYFGTSSTSIAGTYIVNMAAGDTFSVRNAGGGTIQGVSDYHSVFNGCLLG